MPLLTDQMGRRDEMPQHPQRIIPLMHSQTELLCDLDVGERMVKVPSPFQGLRSVLMTVPVLIGIHANAQHVVWNTLIPGANTFSSPRATDLNGDGVADIVVGSGNEMDTDCRGVLAFDGTDGHVLWHLDARSQLFGSPIFHDITGDGVPEVFTGGRRSQFYCLDGRNGAMLWEASPCSQNCNSDSLPNYYTGQWLDDLNHDSIPEILNVWGGFAGAPASETHRPAGHLVILDGRTGATLRRYRTPDDKESYSSPIIWKREGRAPMVLWGSGGETIGGALWGTSVASLWSGQPQFTAVIRDDSKGFISPASTGDVTGDGISDLIALNFNGRVTVVSGDDLSFVWSQQHFPGTESSNVPCLLHFNDDDVLDIAFNLCIGALPKYTGGFHCVLDGKDGKILWRSEPSGQLFHSAVAVQESAGHGDRLFVTVNDTIDGNCMELLSVAMGNMVEVVLAEIGSVNLASTPLLTDLDLDGFLDIILISTDHPDNAHSGDNMRVRRIGTGLKVGLLGITWGGYMGTAGDGSIRQH